MRARDVNEQLMKTSGADVLSPRKKILKKIPPPLVRSRANTEVED